MRPITAMHTMSVCYAAQVPALFLGEPGVGKSHVTFDMKKCLDADYETIRVTHLDVVDLRGLPDLNGTTTYWKRPNWMPDPKNPKHQRGGIIAIEEVTAGIPAIQATLYEIFELRPDGTRHCAGHEIAANWIPFGTGNRLSDRAVSHRLSSALISRLGIFPFEPTLDDWTDYACGGSSLSVPKYAPAPDRLMEPELIAFVRKRPELLSNFDKLKGHDNEPYACPRSWANLNQIFKVCKHNGIGHKPTKGQSFYFSTELASGLVGKTAGAEFCGFLDSFGLPSWEEICVDPDGAMVPEEPSFKYAVAAMIGRQMDGQSFDRALQYLKRLSKAFEVLAIQTCIKVNRDKDGKPVNPKKDLTSCKTWQTWAAKNKEALFYQ